MTEYKLLSEERIKNIYHKYAYGKHKPAVEDDMLLLYGHIMAQNIWIDQLCKNNDKLEAIVSRMTIAEVGT